jgi:catechol 2,3-dioxygenase-like lactoylglutathione lyase family enzyme
MALVAATEGHFAHAPIWVEAGRRVGPSAHGLGLRACHQAGAFVPIRAHRMLSRSGSPVLWGQKGVEMSTPAVSESATGTDRAGASDMKLEVVVIPVSDVDRARDFYAGLGWRLDADFPFDNGFRVVQFTPPGSGCSIVFGTGLTSATPGSLPALLLVVSDIQAARAELVERGASVSEVFHGARARFHLADTSGRVPGWTPNAAATSHTPRSATPTATTGCSKRCSSASPDGDETSVARRPTGTVTAGNPLPQARSTGPIGPAGSITRPPRRTNTRRVPCFRNP